MWHQQMGAAGLTAAPKEPNPDLAGRGILPASSLSEPNGECLV